MSIAEVKRKENIDEGEIEVRLSDIINFLKVSRRRIIVGALIGALIGALYAFSKLDTYSAQITVMPEAQSKSASSLSSLGSLVGLAGIGLDNVGASETIRPDLYPNVLQSTPFALELLKKSVFSQELQRKLTLEEFIAQIDAKSFLNKLLGTSSKTVNNESVENTKINDKNFSQTIQITKKEEGMVKAVQASVSAVFDKKTGILTILVVEPDPVVAATVAGLSLDYLTNYVVTYRTEKARAQVDFLIKRVNESRTRYQSAELALSEYRDRNRSLFLSTAKIGEQRLQADYLLEQSVYNELSKQLEQAKLKVQEETPVFKILEPATVPLSKSSPKRMLIIVGFIAVGIAVSLIAALIKYISSSFQPQRNI